MWTDVLEECIFSIFRVENQPSKTPAYGRRRLKMEVKRSSER
jgi:hypothetical protein